MLFSKYLETLLGSKVKIKMLRAFYRFPTKTFTSRELAKHIKVSHTAVLKSLGDLQGMNILKIESHGTSNLITINQDSFAYSDLKKIFDFEQHTLEYLKEEFKIIFSKAKIIILFGSVAQRKEKFNSDVDLLIVTKNKSWTESAIAANQETFSKRFGNVLSAHIMTENEFKRKRNTPFVKDLLQNHILIKGNKL